MILIAAIVVVAAFFVFDGQNKLKKLKPIVLVSAILGLLLMLLEFARLKDQACGMFEIRYGAVGIIVGFIASLIGIQFLADESVSTNEKD